MVVLGILIFGTDVTPVLRNELEPKLFAVLIYIEIVVSVRRFFTEMMCNDFSFR